MYREKKAPQRDLDKRLCMNCCARLSSTMFGKVSLKVGSHMVHLEAPDTPPLKKHRLKVQGLSDKRHAKVRPAAAERC